MTNYCTCIVTQDKVSFPHPCHHEISLMYYKLDSIGPPRMSVNNSRHQRNNFLKIKGTVFQ